MFRTQRSPFTPRVAAIVVFVLFASVTAACSDDKASESKIATTEPPPAGTIQLVAKDNLWLQEKITLRSTNKKLEVQLKNEDSKSLHDVSIVTADDKTVWKSDVAGGGQTINQTIPDPIPKGTYAFLCTFHPLDMRGTLTVQ